MVIKRKDGSEYKIRGPNKLLMEQDFWYNDERLQLHNFDNIGEKIEVSVAEPVIEVQAVETPIIAEPVIPTAVVEVVGPVPDPVVEEPKVILEPVGQSQYRKRERFYLFCLPTEKVESIDPLYGDVSVRYKYGEPFKFQACAVEDGDARMVYWTTIGKVAEQSVIFHPSRLRWWKVQGVVNEPSGDGWLLHCGPSNVKPDFTTYSDNYTLD